MIFFVVARSRPARTAVRSRSEARRYFRDLVNHLETLPLRGYPYPNLNPMNRKAGGNDVATRHGWPADRALSGHGFMRLRDGASRRRAFESIDSPGRARPGSWYRHDRRAEC